MFARLGSAVARRPLLTLLIWLIGVSVSFVVAMTPLLGDGLFARLSAGEPLVSGSENAHARDLLTEHKDRGESVTLLVHGLDVADPQVAARVSAELPATRADLTAVPGVLDVIDPFVFPAGDPSAAAFTSTAGDGFAIVVTMTPDAGSAREADVIAALRKVPTALGAEGGEVGAATLMTDDILGQMERDLVRGELVALPISLLIMVIVFGGFLAAGMPLAGAIASIGGGLGALYGFSFVLEDMQSVVVNVVTVLGLGLSIDYGLLIVSRYREELRTALAAHPDKPEHGRDPAVQEAIRATSATAGRTVTFSAITVMISIAGLLLLRPDILRALGAAGVSVVLIAVLSALTLVPALLTLIGRRMARPSVLTRVPGLRALLGRLGDVPPPTGFFSRLASRVQRHPWWVLIGTVAALLVMASPVLSMQMRNSTVELLPSTSSQRDFLDVVAADYPGLAAPTLTVVAEGTPAEAKVTDLAKDIAALPEITRVGAPTPLGADHVQFGVFVDTTDPGGDLATQAVRDVRHLRGDDVATYWVAGQAANQVDFNEALAQGLPWAVGVVVLATFVLLFLMTGSLLVPLKALLVNVVSLAASLGVTSWIFVQGHGEKVLGFTAVGGLESYVVAVVIAFGFGLAMDYEVFLLARIKEVYDSTGDNDRAVRDGLQRTGRIITSAALVIVVVFAGFVAGDLLAIKQAGVALALTVLVDATLVRMLLVPSTMTLLGHWNWWAPRPLRRLYEKFAITH